MTVSDTLDDLMVMASVWGECPQHGRWTAVVRAIAVPAGGYCPDCRNERMAAAEAQQAARLASEAAERRRGKHRKAGITERHMGKTLDGFQPNDDAQRRALQAAREMVGADDLRRHPSLVLFGAPGTGKTHLGCAVVAAMIDAGRQACRVSVSEMMRDFKSTYGKGAEHTEEEVLDWYGSVPLLVLDEIGIQFGSDTERMYLFEVINRRYENALPTVMISNLDRDKLRDEVGERVIDRLREDGGRMIAFSGESFRKIRP